MQLENNEAMLRMVEIMEKLLDFTNKEAAALWRVGAAGKSAADAFNKSVISGQGGFTKGPDIQPEPGFAGGTGRIFRDSAGQEGRGL